MATKKPKSRVESPPSSSPVPLSRPKTAQALAGKRAVFYIRVSDIEQKDNFSIPNQVDALVAWCKTLNLQPPKDPRLYLDVQPAGRGVGEKRERFKAMLADAKLGKFDVILCYNHDRFSRDVRFMLETLERLQEHHVWVQFHNIQNVDIYEAQGRMFLQNLTVFAEFFRAQLETKVRDGVKRKRLNEWVGRAPYGFRVVSDRIERGGRVRHVNARLEADDYEMTVVAKILEMREAGKSFGEIASSLSGRLGPTGDFAAKPRAQVRWEKERDERLRDGEPVEDRKPSVWWTSVVYNVYRSFKSLPNAHPMVRKAFDEWRTR